VILKLLDRSRPGGFRLIDGVSDVRFDGAEVRFLRGDGIEAVEVLVGRAFVLNADGHTIESYQPGRQELK
jgi:hypothetical protein